MWSVDFGISKREPGVNSFSYLSRSISVLRVIFVIFVVFISLTLCQTRKALAVSEGSDNELSIGKWARCNGIDDDWHATNLAFSEAASKGFTLVVDCPVRIHIGSDVARPIFIENGTKVVFRKKGLFIIDNTFIPAWVIANSSRIKLIGWRVKYIGRVSADPNTGYYLANGIWKSENTNYHAAASFNDKILTDWLAKHRLINFGKGAYAIWPGPTNTSASFYIVGQSRDIDIVGLKFFVPEHAGPSEFAPAVFQMSVGFKTGEVVQKGQILSQANAAVPSMLRFRNIQLDGTCMGWVGTMEYAEINTVKSWRYADLQEENGMNVGGINKWFAPPHLIYLSSLANAPSFRSRMIHINHVIDNGVRLGVARDKPGERPSGYASSLKLSADNTEVYDYISLRPDGGMDIAHSKNLTVDKMRVSFSSSFLNGLYPGVRVEEGATKGLKISDLLIKDRAMLNEHDSIVLPKGSQKCGVIVNGIMSGTMTKYALTLPRACMGRPREQ